ncbi:hypothetical protein RSAG8_06277, partial [Rhizoctonia solani AG-8 WAC10335]
MRQRAPFAKVPPRVLLVAQQHRWRGSRSADCPSGVTFVLHTHEMESIYMVDIVS